MSLQKSNLSKTYMELSKESNLFKKINAMYHCPFFCPYFRFFFKFLKKCFKHGHGNLVQITSTAQVELSKLNFNFDDIRIYFLQVLRDCRQNFRHAQWILSVKQKTNEIKITPLFLTDNIKMDKILSNQNFLHCVSSFEGISYNNL